MIKNGYSYGCQSISIEDIDQVKKILKSTHLTQGSAIAEFEEKLCQLTGAKFAVAVANGTAALHLATLAIGTNSEDEIITTPMTFAASANCIVYCGGNVKFADIDPDTGLIDPREIEMQITSKTKAIIVVHYAGQSCDMVEIHKIAQRYKLFIIEDAAHAIGSKYKNSKVGSCRYSDMATFSFHPVKTITTGEGGAITTNDKNLHEKLKNLRTHGITKEANSFLNPNKLEIGPWYYEMQALGFNYRLSDIQAGLGLSQMKRLDMFVKRRGEIVVQYQKAFKNDDRFSVLKENRQNQTAYHLFPLLLNFEKLKMSKTQIIEQLNMNHIFPQVHYIPVHLHPFYYELGYRLGDYPNAELFYERELSIPLYPDLKDTDVRKIISIIKKVIK